MPKKQLALLVTIALLFGCAKAEIGVRPTAAQSVSYVSYTQPEGLFTMQIPSGWQVGTGGDYISYIIDVYDPQNPQCEIYIQLCGVGFQSAEGAALAQSYNLMGDRL